jgi:hypothetical protein
MTYAPTQILGPIIPQSNGSSTALPGVTQSGFFGGAVVSGSGKSRELYTRAPYGSNLSGVTSEYASHIFLNNEFLSFGVNLISGFVPNYYIDVFKNIEPTFIGATGSVSLPATSGIQKGRWEIITISYNKQTFLTSLAGATAEAITSLNVVHDIVPGNQTITAEHIYYRKIGNVS